MKTLLFLLVLTGVVWVACRKKEPPHPTVSDGPAVRDRAGDALQAAADKTRSATAIVAERSREFASEVRDTWEKKRVEWRLTDSDIRTDLEKTGVLIREKSEAVGEKVGVAVDNARVVTVIKSKLIAEPGLSALHINVDADRGVVTLNGSVKSVDMIGRTTALALETEGVTRVISLLHVES